MKWMLMIALMATAGAGALWITADRAFADGNATTSRKVLYYTCPMHPSVRADKAGACPVCGMNLVPVYDAESVTNSPPTTVNTNEPAETVPGCCSPASGSNQ